MKWQKIRYVLMVISALLFALSLLYIVYLKAKFLFNI